MSEKLATITVGGMQGSLITNASDLATFFMVLAFIFTISLGSSMLSITLETLKKITLHILE